MAIKLKRGTTESWTFGPELVDFGRSSTKGKDSIIRAEGTELEMYVYTTSANEWYVEDPATSTNSGKTDGKIPGLPIDFGIEEHNSDKTYRLVVDFEGPEDCNLELVGWGGSLVRPDYSDGPYVDSAYQSSGTLSGFVKWPAEKVGVVAPVPIKIRISYREVGVYEELEEGQLGLEYTEDGNVKLKAGMPGLTQWNELPYINVMPPLEVYFTGIEEEINNSNMQYYKIQNFNISHSIAECRKAIAEGRTVYFLGEIGEHVYCGGLDYAMPNNDYESGYTVAHCLNYYNPNDIRIITLSGYEEWFDDSADGTAQIFMIATNNMVQEAHNRINTLETTISLLSERVTALETSDV